jgi:hypothetical protein
MRRQMALLPPIAFDALMPLLSFTRCFTLPADLPLSPFLLLRRHYAFSFIIDFLLLDADTFSIFFDGQQLRVPLSPGRQPLLRISPPVMPCRFFSAAAFSSPMPPYFDCSHC